MQKSDSGKSTTVSVNLPFGLGNVEWKPNKIERRAAWSLYVELVTRIAVQSLEKEEGILREALNSLYSLFDRTREILKESGPDVGASKYSVGGIAIFVLNKGLRPFLAKWHPLLENWEARRESEISPQEHEKKWPDEKHLRKELESLRISLEVYANSLATIAGVDKT